MNAWMSMSSVALIVVMLAFSACGEEETAPVVPSVVEGILPLRMGLTWKYSSTRFEPDGTVLSVESLNLKVQTSVSRDNETWYSYGVGDTGNFYTNRADGLYTRYHSRYLGLDYWSPPKLLLKYPVQKGETFTDADNHAVSVASVDQYVSVRAGNYGCVVYVQTDPDVDSSDAHWRNVMYYCPGVGRVLLEQYARTFDDTMFLLIRSELTQAPGI